METKELAFAAKKVVPVIVKAVDDILKCCSKHSEYMKTCKWLFGLISGFLRRGLQQSNLSSAAVFFRQEWDKQTTAKYKLDWLEKSSKLSLTKPKSLLIEPVTWNPCTS